ncbi:hypothetical protein JVU11DRAFT_3505 [Chiua virens]|nr:hypothetical protein JVU11DRAFT_3505 [Chiua virens]
MLMVSGKPQSITFLAPKRIQFSYGNHILPFHPRLIRDTDLPVMQSHCSITQTIKAILPPPSRHHRNAWNRGSSRGSLSSPGDAGINSPPCYPVYAYPKFPGVKSGHVVGRGRATSVPHLDSVSMVAQPSPFSLAWQDDTRKKSVAYKTKPCKFYAATGKCTSGEKCTFIHDPESKGNGDTPRTELAPLIDADLPPKPRDRYEEYRAKDFYPITWRVIGGGVMMGGKRQICPAFTAGYCKYGDDCKLAHETELETDAVGFIKLKNGGVRKGEESFPPHVKGTPSKRARSGSQKTKSIKVPSAATQEAVHFPSTAPPQKPDVPPRETPEAARKKDGGYLRQRRRCTDGRGPCPWSSLHHL